MAFNVGAASIIVKIITVQARKDLDSLRGKLKDTYGEAENARETFRSLTRTSYALGPAIATVIGGISALIGSLVSIVGAAGAAGASIVVLGNVFAGFGLAMLSAKIALGGVLQALGKMGQGGGSAAKNTDALRLAQQRLAQVIEQNNERLFQANKQITDAQINLNDALAAGREELQQLGFAAEEAALAQQGAALDLERAREELARVQDLPPNSRIRREAELAFAQAELQYRQAVDANADIAKEQEKYSQAGVEGTQQVIDARQRLAEAEANLASVVRDGLRAQLEAEQALKKAKEQPASGGGTDPFANLTKSQIEFVKRMYALKPLFKAVQEQIASAFLPILGGAVSKFAHQVLPTMGSGLALIAGELANVIKNTVKWMASTEGLSMFEDLFRNSANLIKPMGDALGLLMQIFIRMVNAAAPVAQRFVQWIIDGFSSFNDYLAKLDSDGSLTKFFQDAGDAAGEFGSLFGEVFRWLGQIIKTNLGEDSPGRDMVRWLTDGLRASNNLRDSKLFGPDGLAQYFADVNNNTKQILSSLGALGKVFVTIGANQNVGKVFTILKTGAPAIGAMLDKLVNAAPSFAELIAVVSGLINAFTDSNQIIAFFDTLTGIAKVLLDVISSEPVQAFMTFFGPLLGFLMAVTLAFKLFRFAVLVLSGELIALSKVFLAVDAALVGSTATTGVLSMAFQTLKASIISAAESMALWVMYNPILAAIAVAVIAVSAGFIALNNYIESTASSAEDFKNVIDGTNKSVNILSALTKKTTLNEIFDPSQVERNNRAMQDLNKNYDSAAVSWMAFNNIASLGLVPLRETVAGNYELRAAMEDTTNAIHDFNTKASELPADVVVRGLQQITDEGNASRETTLEIINTNENLRNSLVQIATQAGITASDSNLVSIAMGDIKTAALDAALNLPTLGQALSDLTSNFVDDERAQIKVREAFREGNKFAKEHAGELEGTGKKADAARSKLLDMRDSILAGVDAVRQKGGDVNAYWDEQRTKLERVAEQLFTNKEDAQAYVDEILGTPEDVTTVIKQRVELNTIPARQEIQSFANYVSTQFRGKLPDAIASSVDSYIKANYNPETVSWFAKHVKSAQGNMFSYAGEGIYSGRYAGIHKFAEPETGWEAYVSGRKGSEARNRAILTEAASRLGMNIGGGGVNIVVNPSPGMDERALAGAVSQEITKLMRKGSIY